MSSSLHAELGEVMFGHGNQASAYEFKLRTASGGLIDTKERFDTSGKPRNAHRALLQEIQEQCQADVLKVTEQFPGFAMWQMRWKSQSTKPLPPKFLQAGVLAVCHRIASVYFQEMTRLAQGAASAVAVSRRHCGCVARSLVSLYRSTLS